MPSEESKNILIVEDDVFISSIYVVEMEAGGFKVETATDIRQALKALGKKRFSLILLDIVMPNENGFKLLKEVKRNPSLNTKVVVFSNLSSQENIKKALDLGADDYIIKTQFTPQEVIGRIKEIMNNN